MMNSNPNITSRVVIGVGLLVVFGLGVSEFVLHANKENQIAAASAPASDQIVPNTTAPAPGAAVPTAPEQPETPAGAAATAAAPAASTPAVPSTSTPAATKSSRADRRAASTHNSDSGAIRVASAATSDRAKSSQESASSLSSSDAASSSPGLSAETQPTAAPTGQEAALSAGPAAAGEPVASDSQITASVKAEIATAAPNSNVEVTTTNGVVALAGSVPSQDIVEQARQAAQRVAGVKHVDASGLMVSNQ